MCVCSVANAQAPQHNQDNSGTTFFSSAPKFTPTRHFNGLTVGIFDPTPGQTNENVLFLGGSHGSRGLAWNSLEDVNGIFRYTAGRNAFKMDYSNWNNYAVWRFSQNSPSAGTPVTWQTAMQLQKISNGDINLRLCGDFFAREININSGIGWCDYVFAPEYKLRSLGEVEAFIKKNKHLPEVPSEKEVYEEGISVTEMLQIQMKKIEELTLYAIQQQKELEELRVLLKAQK
jgi:hypothetical protein